MGARPCVFFTMSPVIQKTWIFALERTPETYSFQAYLRQIERDFAAEAYTLDF